MTVRTDVHPAGGASAPPRKPSVVIQADKRLGNLGLAAAWEYRELMYFFVWRDLKVRYRQTVIGAAWVILQPVAMAVSFTAIFSYLARMPSDGRPYPLFVLAAVLPWTYFSAAMGRASLSLVANGNLLTKVYFPRMLVPLGAVITPGIDLLASMPVIGVLMWWYGVVPGVEIVALPLLFLLVVLVAFTFGLFFSAMNVKYRDVGQIIPFALQIWMYASPVVYPLSAVPEAWRPVYALNPMVGVIAGFRWSLLGGGAAAAPSLEMAFSAVIAGVLLVGALLYFRRMERTFADVV